MFILKFFQTLIFISSFAGTEVSNVGSEKGQIIEPEVKIISGLPSNGVLEFSPVIKFKLELKTTETVTIRILMKDASETIYFETFSDTGPQIIYPNRHSLNTQVDSELSVKSRNLRKLDSHFARTRGLLMNLVVEVKSLQGKMLVEEKHKVLMKAGMISAKTFEETPEGKLLKIEDDYRNKNRVDVIFDQNDEVWQGQIDREAVRRAIRSQLNFFKSCYYRELKKNKISPGKIYLSFEIHRSGAGQNILILKDKTTIENQIFKECVRSRLEIIKFPKPLDEVAEILNYSIEFK